MKRRPGRRMIGVTAAAVVTCVLAACGATTTNPGSATSQSSSTSSAPASAGTSSAAGAPTSPAASSAADGGDVDVTPLDLHLSADPALAAKVPDSIKKAGTLTIVTDPTYAPIDFRVNGTGPIVGMDVDLGNAVGELLGLKTQWIQGSFDGILAGLNAGRYDISFAAMTVTASREEQVNFVTYYRAGVSIMVAAGNPEHINSYTDLCGKTVGAQNGTTEFDMLTKSDVDLSVVAACAKAGKPPVDAKGFPLQSDVNSALAGGRISAYLADTPVVLYAVKLTGDRFERVGQDQGVAPYGVAIPKQPAGLAPVIQQAMQQLMDSGDYTKILTNWGLQDGGISKAELNPSVS